MNCSGRSKPFHIRKTVPRKCSSPKRICIVCKTKAIHKNDQQYEKKICFSCEALNKGIPLAKMNWSRASRDCVGSPDSSTKVEPTVGRYTLTAEITELFELALKRSAGSHHYKAVLSIHRQFLMIGRVTIRQAAYIRWLANKTPIAHPGC